MSIVEFTQFIVSKLATEPDMVSVKEFDHDDELVIEVLVSEADMGRIIGKQGRNANAIKTLVQAKAYNDGKRRVRVNIDSF